MNKPHYNVDMKASDVRVRFYPELVSASLKRREADLYFLWLILKSIECHLRETSGHFSMSEMLNLVQIAYNIKSSRAYALLAKGQGLYWGIFAGTKGQKSTSLYSKRRICNHLAPEMTRTRPFDLTLADFSMGRDVEGRAGWPHIKSILVGLVASRSDDLRPTSYQTMFQHTGLSRSTLYRQIRNCSGLKVYRNIHLLAQDYSYERLHRRCKDLIWKHKSKRFVVTSGVGGKYYLLEQLPNSYHFPELNRASFRSRCKELRMFDKDNAIGASDKLYYQDDESASKGTVKYIFTKKYAKTRAGQLTRMWKRVEANC